MIVDGELSGDNRTSMLFDVYYEDWLKNGNVINGYGKKLMVRMVKLQIYYMDVLVLNVSFCEWDHRCYISWSFVLFFVL